MWGAAHACPFNPHLNPHICTFSSNPSPPPTPAEAEDIIRSLPAGLCCGGSHLATLASIAGGGLAFSQIVKAAEPVFSGCVGTVFYGTRLPAKNWLCFVPICGGILLASLKLSDSAVVAAAGASAASTTTGMPIPAALDAFLFNARIALSALYSPASIELDFSVASLVAAVLANTFAGASAVCVRLCVCVRVCVCAAADPPTLI